MTFAEENSSQEMESSRPKSSKCVCVRQRGREKKCACESNFVYKPDIFHDIC